MKHRWIAWLVWAAACGGGGGGGGVDTGLPPDEKLSELDDASVKQACQAVDDSLASVLTPSETLRVQCTSIAITASASTLNGELTVDTQKCKQMTDACIAHPPASVTDASDDDDLDCSMAMANAKLASCVATVSEFEGCINATVNDARQRAASFTCANGKMLLTDSESESDSDSEYASLPECKALQADCPDLSLTGSD